MNTEQLLAQAQDHRVNFGTYHAILIGNNQMDVFPNQQGWPSPTRLRRRGGEWVYQQGPKIVIPKSIAGYVHART